jgi:hypothetical protein
VLSEFEYLILSATGLGEEAYGAAMREEVIETTPRRASGSFHASRKIFAQIHDFFDRFLTELPHLS